MSTVRYFDDVPHIVRFGMKTEEDEFCWILFYRNGNVYGTAFYSAWRPLLAEPKPGDSMADSVAKMLDRHNNLCDLIISHSMTTLQKLAPVGPHWITLRDYLHTPAYSLKLVTEMETTNVHPEVTKGPEDVAAYEFQPLPFTAFINLPKTIPQYPSSELVILDRELNWRNPPHKVRTTDGLVCYFKACKRSSTWVETGEVQNDALDSIEAHLCLLKYGQEKHDTYATRKSTVLGIVTDTSFVSDESASAIQVVLDRTGQKYKHDAEMSQTLVAGILLSSTTSSQSLANVIAQAEDTTSDIFAEQVRSWKTQIEEEVVHLHSAGICYGGRDDWFNINQYTVLIGAESNASLDLDTATFVDDSNIDDTGRKFTSMDNLAVESLFGKWLQAELTKKGG
ncbi:hypothetical protein TSTA_112380 [Talaromyces stipitatus ATCC 10500]|uniref:Uncharacterized protein n=1 Tax=Talaromyces stipitatus (strain ATCC 10500 / CBS 375.48 / QM 6759 / NRRL 1006) TaxID=441959 RepID=B8MAI0_TALSN|nr:uncharacterized protein TSTA_112380 [Talaromyces stipitatus ATCC 10500]EED17404.1 hypothetical protein TSTA_112380 [Talaromyces stipitatus ATCC 10500]